MSGDRLPQACYGMLKVLDDCSRVTWALNILLCNFSFEYVGNTHSVQDENACWCVFEGLKGPLGMRYFKCCQF